MAMFNFGGPGWFRDVFEIEVTVDTEQKVACRSLLFSEECPVFKGDDKITGKVKIVAPPNRSVWHYGCTVRLERTTSFYDSMRSVDEELTHDLVAEAEYVTGTKEYEFTIDLAHVEGLVDAYDGEMFSIRYGISASLARPWYTFDVIGNQPCAIHMIEAAPGDGKAVAPAGVTIPAELQVPTESRISVPDAGGDVVFTYDKECYNIGDTLKGKVALTDLPRRITSVKIVFYKIEKGDNDENESVIREFSVMEPADTEDDTPPPPPPKPTETAEEGTADDSAGKDAAEPPVPPPKPELTTDKEFDVECKLDDTPAVAVSPTYYDLQVEDDAISVHYYLRLLLSDAEGQKFWNTHEVVMYRAGLTGLKMVEV